MSTGKPAVKYSRIENPVYSAKPDEVLYPSPRGIETIVRFKGEPQAIDGTREQDVSFEFSVARNSVVRFCEPCCFVKYKVTVPGAVAGEIRSPRATDRLILKCPWAVIQSVRGIWNSNTLDNWSYTGQDLERMISLNLRLGYGDPWADPLKDFRSSMPMKGISFDTAGDANTATPLANYWVKLLTEEEVWFPIPLPMFPFGCVPLEGQLSGRDPRAVRNKFFHEHMKFSWSIRTNTNAHVQKYIHRTRGNVAGAVQAADLSLEIKDIAFYGRVETFPEGHPYVRSIRSIRGSPSGRLTYPHCLISLHKMSVTAGKRKNIITFSTKAFKERFMVLYFTDQDDIDGNALKPANSPDFLVPAALHSLDVRFANETSSVVNGPVASFATRGDDPNKMWFYQQQVQYTHAKPTYHDYWDVSQCNRQIVIDLTTKAAVAGGYDEMSDLEVHLDWGNQQSPADLWLVAAGFQNAFYKIDKNNALERSTMPPLPAPIE